jgi:hypothetical protein
MSTIHTAYIHCFRNGLYDSVCRTCFRTVSSQDWENDLADDEERHLCKPEHVYSFRLYSSFRLYVELETVKGKPN